MSLASNFDLSSAFFTPPRSTARSNPTRSSTLPSALAITLAMKRPIDQDDQEHEQLRHEHGDRVQAVLECILHDGIPPSESG